VRRIRRSSRFAFYAVGDLPACRLEIKDAVHIDNWGTFVTTPKVSAAASTVHVRATVVNQSDAPRDVTMLINLMNPEGQIVAMAETVPQTVARGKMVDFDQT